MERRTVRVVIVGSGFVGTELVTMLLDANRQIAIEDAALAHIEIVGVGVRDLTKARPGVPAELLTDNIDELLSRDFDILVELVGGTDDAKRYVETALARGKSVVSANKALIAQEGTRLFALADANGADFFYEAAVAGAIPIVRALKTSLAGEKLDRVMGIVNGTTNFILSKMTVEGSSYDEVLAEAQALGFAEANPSADVDGFDAASKVAILSSLAFGTSLDAVEVAREGITNVRALDVEFATRQGFVIKLLGVAERVGEHGVSLRVHPVMIRSSHPLASVHGAMNAVFVDGPRSGPLMWLGKGAGGAPTATAVLGDLLDAARNIVAERHDVPFTPDDRLFLVDSDNISSEFYISLDVVDRPGVMSQVTGVFGRHGVSIRSMEQAGVGEDARLSFITHEARSGDVKATLLELAELDAVDVVANSIRVLEDAN
jgi:homoserine dehydrogenase